MRTLLFSILFVVLHLTSTGQKISYTVPEDYQNDISKEDYKKLVDMSLPIVAKHFAIDNLSDGTIQLKSGQEMQALNLHNLILKCAAAKDKSTWNGIIRDHFENLFLSIDERRKIDETNYESIKKYLSLRIYPSGTVLERGGLESVVGRQDLEGTYTLLMLDLPGAFTAVQRSTFTRWKKDTAEVFQLAQENINKQKVEKLTQFFDIDGSSIEIGFLGEENYAASYALDLLHNAPDLVGEWGSVVVIPNKGLVNLCKINRARPLDFVKFIQRTKPLTEKSFRNHPQPISEDYFWYYKGRFTKINVTTDSHGQISVVAPFGLSQLMTEKN